MAERSEPGRGPHRQASTDVIEVALLGGTRGLWTEAVAWMLTSDGYQLVAAFDTVDELMAELAGVRAELLLIDLDDRPIDWTAIGRVRAERPDLKLVLITAALSTGAAEAIRADRLDGVIDKTDSADQARATLLHVHEGRRVFPAGWQDAVRPKGQGAEGLSAREFAILELVASGLRNTEIASELTISPNTVKFHLRAVYAQLGVRNRVEAAQAFARMRRTG
ncbi:MAG: response regulator transcription factor [Solirubrobacteraceae bacterium]|jgi:two-component system nitrate/nitrite response regulator NarP